MSTAGNVIELAFSARHDAAIAIALLFVSLSVKLMDHVDTVQDTDTFFAIQYRDRVFCGQNSWSWVLLASEGVPD